MVMLVLDPPVEERLKAERAACGLNLFDEVWDGLYLVPPAADREHQQLLTRLIDALQEVIGVGNRDIVQPTPSVSDRGEGWERDYRVPDVTVFLSGGSARNQGTHWVGGPDLAIEVLSPGDRALEKLPFYARVGVRELLLLDRAPWLLDLYRLEGDRLEPAGRSAPDRPEALASGILPLSFRLAPGASRPQVEVIHADGRRWLA